MHGRHPTRDGVPGDKDKYQKVLHVRGVIIPYTDIYIFKKQYLYYINTRNFREIYETINKIYQRSAIETVVELPVTIINIK